MTMKEEISFEIDMKFLQKVLQDKESDPSLKIVNVNSSAACSIGDNYMSSVCRLVLTVVGSDNNTFERFLLVKKQPSNAAWREAFGCDSAFLNEASAYHNVIPEMNKFCSSSNLAFPQCFYASVEYTILEDLKPMGFRMADRRAGLDLAHAKLALKELGRFHGVSLAMKHSKPKLFDKLTSSAQEIFFLKEKKNGLGKIIENSLRMASMGLKVYRAMGTDCFEQVIHKLQLLKKSAFERLMNVVKPGEALSVLCHGDFYINNMMFKYDAGGDVSGIMLVDLQAIRYASLSLDLLYFMSSSLGPGLLSANFTDLVAEYHSSLNQQIKSCAPAGPEVSLKEIFYELESHSTYGLLMGLLVLPAVTASPERTFDIDEVESFSSQDYFDRGLDILSPAYFQRLSQLVTDYSQLGYL